MKNKTMIFYLCTVVFFLAACNPSVPVPATNSANHCYDSCSIANDYCTSDGPLKDSGYQIVAADIRIDTFTVTKDAAHLTLYVHVSSNNDDDAHEAKLVILLPADVCNVSVVNTDPQIMSYKQCGGEIEFCLGQLATSGAASMRSVTIRTDMAKLPQLKGKESFAGFVYSSTPDLCPLNNYRAWVNDSVSCSNGFNAADLVKKGF
jgi:hypothetical protein